MNSEKNPKVERLELPVKSVEHIIQPFYISKDNCLSGVKTKLLSAVKKDPFSIHNVLITIDSNLTWVPYYYCVGKVVEVNGLNTIQINFLNTWPDSIQLQIDVEQLLWGQAILKQADEHRMFDKENKRHLDSAKNIWNSGNKKYYAIDSVRYISF
jgi:hypothetical protein